MRNRQKVHGEPREENFLTRSVLPHNPFVGTIVNREKILRGAETVFPPIRPVLKLRRRVIWLGRMCVCGVSVGVGVGFGGVVGVGAGVGVVLVLVLAVFVSVMSLVVLVLVVVGWVGKG